MTSKKTHPANWKVSQNEILLTTDIADDVVNGYNIELTFNWEYYQIRCHDSEIAYYKIHQSITIIMKLYPHQMTDKVLQLMIQLVSSFINKIFVNISAHSENKKNAVLD